MTRYRRFRIDQSDVWTLVRHSDMGLMSVRRFWNAPSQTTLLLFLALDSAQCHADDEPGTSVLTLDITGQPRYDRQLDPPAT